MKFLREAFANTIDMFREVFSNRMLNGRLECEAQPDVMSAMLHQQRDELHETLVRFSSKEWVEESLASYTMQATLVRLMRWRRQEIDELKHNREDLSRLLDCYRTALGQSAKLVPNDMDQYAMDIHELVELNKNDQQVPRCD